MSLEDNVAVKVLTDRGIRLGLKQGLEQGLEKGKEQTLRIAIEAGVEMEVLRRICEKSGISNERLEELLKEAGAILNYILVKK